MREKNKAEIFTRSGRRSASARFTTTEKRFTWKILQKQC